MLHDLQQVSQFALLMLGIGMLPLALGLAYALRPVERWLTLMRPVSLAAIFAALSSLMSGVTVILHGLGATLEGRSLSLAAMGMAEAFAPMLMIFACLTLGWLLVALGEFRVLRRTPTALP